MKNEIISILHESDNLVNPLDSHGMMDFFFGGLLMWIMMLVGIIILLLLITWTYGDANKRGENALLWSFIVFFTMGLGIIVYILIRNSNNNYPQQVTTTYQSEVNNNHLKHSKEVFCENCGSKLNIGDDFCRKCGEKNWSS